jgi:hypothetical protein
MILATSVYAIYLHWKYIYKGQTSLIMLATDTYVPTRQMIAQCEIEAVHLYPQYEAGVSDQYPYLSYVQTCMEAHGYYWDSTRAHCSNGFQEQDCYTPPPH